MLCEKCGKNNPENALICSNCGSEMPQTEKCNGFADILTYTPPESNGANESYSSAYSANQTEGISEFDMKKIIRKTDNIIKISQKNTLFGLISVVLGCVIIICSVLSITSSKQNAREIDALKKTIESLAGNNNDDAASINKIRNELTELTQELKTITSSGELALSEDKMILCEEQLKKCEEELRTINGEKANNLKTWIKTIRKDYNIGQNN